MICPERCGLQGLWKLRSDMVPEKILVGIIYGVFPLETALTRGLKITKGKLSTEAEMVVETFSTRQWL